MRDVLERHSKQTCFNSLGRAVCAQDRKRAIATARQVREKMHNSERWKIHVWENLGWHWELVNGYITLSGTYRDRGSPLYHAMFADELPPCGSPHYWYSGPGKGYFKDPNKAVDYVFKFAEQFADDVQGIVEYQRRLLTVIKYVRGQSLK